LLGNKCDRYNDKKTRKEAKRMCPFLGFDIEYMAVAYSCFAWETPCPPVPPRLMEENPPVTSQGRDSLLKNERERDM
jgi:hypothetical protein